MDFFKPTTDHRGRFLAYVNVGGFHLVQDALGAPAPDAYWDPEAGYEGDEWYFKSPDDICYSLYARYGSYRIGGESMVHFDRFVKFLEQKGIKLEVKGYTHVYEMMGT